MAIDDTLLRRRGRKVWAASWCHDGSAPGRHKTGYGNNWVVLAIIVWLPFCSRPVALPVLAKLVVKGTKSGSRLWLAARMTQMLADALPGRDVHVVADSAYAEEELGKLGKGITCTARLRKDAALYALPPERTAAPTCRPWPGSPAPRTSRRSPSPATARPPPCTPPRSPACGTPSSVPRHTRVVLIRDTSATGYDLALVTTDLNAGTAAIIERYASRWSIEDAIEDAKSRY